ncbi:MAG: hypothetical protein IKD92_08610 [Lachnospiraceae bacterium]|nr:hypothetical protein [Sarcina sp.]MBR2729903.1 hypothetical protein [Lachnospiraceae bacterium]
MDNRLFRKKSIDRISSPEQLEDYMRVTSPAIWMVLAAVIALLGGLLVCSSVGRVETTMPVQATASGGTVTVEIPVETEQTDGEQKEAPVRPGMVIRISGKEGKIDYVFQEKTGVITCTAPFDLRDGVYDARIVTESIHPIEFLLN